MQYVPFASDIEIPFYASLASHKINHDKLDDSARKLLGLYEIRPSDAKENSCRMQVHGNALTADDIPAGTTGFCRAEGIIKNVNTIEEYRNIDKIGMLQQAGKTIWDAINDGTIYSCPSLLASFLVLSFADLKKYRFNYWFAFPALVMEPSWTPVAENLSVEGSTIPHKKLSPVESAALVDTVQTWRYGVDSRQHGFFLAKKNRRLSSKPLPVPELTTDEAPDDLYGEEDFDGSPAPSNKDEGEDPGNIADEEEDTNIIDDNEDDDVKPNVPQMPAENLGFIWQVGSLSQYDTGFFEGQYSDDCYVCFADPSNYTDPPGPIAPGWMLRNLLCLVRQKWKRDRIQILCYRETPTRKDAARSVVLDMEVSRPTTRSSSFKKKKEAEQEGKQQQQQQQQQERSPTDLPKVVGWERNGQGKLAGRMANLTEYMDPKKLADSSVDLNLKLMKWRISPNLDLEKIKDTKCLLLGAGTLGSYVSRNLMGWGVRTITFVDNGLVSFSNPVRQPLFNFDDCLEGGKKKAVQAAEALRKIYPGVDSNGHVFSVPMAGHPVMDAQRTKTEFIQLKTLIDKHDVIFLLMDTRESRWLPTVMGKVAGKVVLNAALGFDSCVVMRHGVRPADASEQQLGCYFCNDVVAPADSIKDQTLDQQCTVTRPGIAAIASALLVEMMVSVLQHPDGAAAPAPISTQQDRGEHPLGLVPHTIRCFLSNFTNMNIVGRSYDCCSACSERVLQAYEKDGWDFVEKCLNDRDYVEELSGLKEVQRAAEAAAADIELSDDELSEDEGEGELI